MVQSRRRTNGNKTGEISFATAISAQTARQGNASISAAGSATTSLHLIPLKGGRTTRSKMEGSNGTRVLRTSSTDNGVVANMVEDFSKAATGSTPTDFEALREIHLRPLMDLNDRINALTAKETKINATRIVVAGDQSHGKTSLLEALCGVNLPRGEGIQTRVPLVLQMRRRPPQEHGEDEEYAIISIDESAALGVLGARRDRISVQQIGEKVREFTALAAGPGKSIANAPIQLSIFRSASSSQQDDLTLVDLPGITRVALDDQAGGDGRKLEQQILDMCRTYMQPKESILLNVVSSMVDFSTSASLQLSRELDEKGKRTLLCVTKVDQHASEGGLHEKIQNACQTMRLNPRQVFAVRNRSQQENNVELPLPEVRRLERTALAKLTNGQEVEYQLGVTDLSRYLVKRQCEEILHTLPRTQSSIEEVIAQLEEQLAALGEPVGDAGACRAKAAQLIDACASRLQGETRGYVSSETGDEADVTGEGEAFELSLTVPDFQAFLKGKETKKWSEPVRIGIFAFKLFIEEKEENNSNEDAGASIGVYVHVARRDSASSLGGTVDVVCEFVATSERSELARFRMEQEYDLSGEDSWGNSSFWSIDSNPPRGGVVFTANVFVEAVTIQSRQEAAEEAGSLTSSLFCARLAELQDKLTEDIDRLYSNAHFFSESFRMSLSRELQGTRGGFGLPGIIAPHVPVGMLKKLRTKLADPVRDHREKILEECRETTGAVIDHYVEVELHPQLNSLFHDRTFEIFEKQSKELKRYHRKLLEWEQTICSSNHYFMDTVNSIKAQIYDKSVKEKPLYLQHLTPQVIKAMSNEDQKLVDIQIEIFAYWKLMKKRLVDYIILSTQAELVNKPIFETLKPDLMDAVFRHDNLVQLLSPDPVVEQTRSSYTSRLGKLRQAMHDIVEYKTKHPGGWMKID